MKYINLAFIIGIPIFKYIYPVAFPFAWFFLPAGIELLNNYLTDVLAEELREEIIENIFAGLPHDHLEQLFWIRHAAVLSIDEFKLELIADQKQVFLILLHSLNFVGLIDLLGIN